MATTRRFELTDAEWDILKPLLPPDLAVST
jgi:transposase